MATRVATLVAPAPQFKLNDTILRAVAGSLPAPRAPRWLDESIAADIGFTPEPGNDDRKISEALRSRLSGAPVDVFVQPLRDRRKKLLVADMDSTVIEQECIDEMADFAGKRAHVAAITESAMRGEIAFEAALRERVAVLAGLDVGIIKDIIKNRIRLTAGARTLVQTMRAHGACTVLVSGGFTLFTGEIAAMIGFDDHRANVLTLNGDKLAGRVNEPVLGAAAKLEALRHFRAAKGLTATQTLAIGDGANDLAMIEQAGFGIAFHAKPSVAAAAHARIDHCDLSAALYAQGYRRSDFRS